nr:MAG TPA: hypothetical protein [Caudoviricetes sp.]
MPEKAKRPRCWNTESVSRPACPKALPANTGLGPL